MRILPQLSSQHYTYGYNEAASSVIPFQQTQTELDVYESSFWMDSNLYSNYINENQSGKVLPFCSQNQINHHSGPNSLGEDLSIHSPLSKLPLLANNSSVIGIETNCVQVAEKPRKRSIGRVVERSPTKKKMEKCFQHQFNYHELLPRERVPMKRSHKLSDKITALQKLVSPYGKTDTASVLHEAAISVKALQHQIQNLCDNSQSMISASPSGCIDLRREGLCLVPLSLAKILTEADISTKILNP